MELIDEEMLLQIQEKDCIQFFLGSSGYSSRAPNDPSKIVLCRKYSSGDVLKWIN